MTGVSTQLIGAIQYRRETGKVHVAAFAVRRRVPARAVRQFRADIRQRVIAAELLDEPRQSVGRVGCNVRVLGRVHTQRFFIE